MAPNELTEILERLARIEAKLENGLCEDIRDHERRIRALERFMWTAFGTLAILQIILKFIPWPWR